MKSISRFKMLVHADYVALNDDHAELGLHPLQLRLREAWDQEFKGVNGTSTLFLYASSLKQRTLSRGFRDIGVLKHPIEREDILRITRYREELGSGLVLIPNGIAITTSLLTDEMAKREIILGNDPELEVFGEFYGAGFTCVESWGREGKQALGVSDGRYTIREELCFPTSAYDEVIEWQKKRNRAAGILPRSIERF